MRKRSFIEETATEALRKAKEACGSDVIVLETKKIQSPQPGKFLVEVVVSVDDELEQEQGNKIKQERIANAYGVYTNEYDNTPKSKMQIEHKEEIAYELEQLSKQVSQLQQSKSHKNHIADNQPNQQINQPVNKPAFQPQPQLQPQPSISTQQIATSKNTENIQELASFEPSTSDVVVNKDNKIDLQVQNTQAFVDFKSQISKMQKNISIIRHSLKNDFSTKKKENNSLVIPPEFKSIYEHFKTNELDDDLIDMILSKTISSVPLSLKNNEYKLHKFFGAIISRITRTKDESVGSDSMVFMVCGSLGSGKSASVFKIASKLSQNSDDKVACISLAQDENSHHNKSFESLSLSHNVYYDFAPTPDKLKEVLDNLSDYKYILLDTSGINYYENMDLLLQYKMQIRYSTAKTLLVLGSDMKIKDYNLLYDAHQRLDVHSIIATKLDITNSIGNLISFVYDRKIPISYVSFGQSVDKFDKANSDFIAKAFMDIGSVSAIKKEYSNKEAKWETEE